MRKRKMLSKNPIVMYKVSIFGDITYYEGELEYRKNIMRRYSWYRQRSVHQTGSFIVYKTVAYPNDDGVHSVYWKRVLMESNSYGERDEGIKDL